MNCYASVAPPVPRTRSPGRQERWTPKRARKPMLQPRKREAARTRAVWRWTRLIVYGLSVIIVIIALGLLAARPSASVAAEPIRATSPTPDPSNREEQGK